MIGGGVFVLTGIALQQAGPSALISFLVAGAIVSLSALSFAVIASHASAKESGYASVGDVLGSPVWGFLTSWCFYLGGIIGAAFVLNAFGIYMHEFIASNVSVLWWALIGAFVLTLVNLGPASEIGKIETFLVTGKLVILAILVGYGVMHFHVGDLSPFAPGGLPQVFGTSSYLFIAFLGFNVITSIAGDIHKPQKTVPRAILLSMVVVTIVYVGIVVALLAAHMTNYSEASVGEVAQKLIGPIGGGLIIFGALVATLSAANANILGSSEIMLRLAGRKLVPTILGHLRGGHPYVSVLAGAILCVLLILSRQTTIVIGLANVTAIIALVIVNAAAIKLLLQKHRMGFRLPFGWVLPVLGAVGAIAQIFFIPTSTTLLGVILVGVGLVIYAVRETYYLPRQHREITIAVDGVEGPLGRTLK